MKNKLFIPTIVALVCLFSIGYGSTFAQDKSDATIVNINAANYDATIAKGVVLVDFWAPWCPPCRKMNPILEATAKEYSGVAKIVKLNTDDNQDLAVKLKIATIPTIIVYKDGKEVNRIVGIVTQKRLGETITQYTAKK